MKQFKSMCNVTVDRLWPTFPTCASSCFFLFHILWLGINSLCLLLLGWICWIPPRLESFSNLSTTTNTKIIWTIWTISVKIYNRGIAVVTVEKRRKFYQIKYIHNTINIISILRNHDHVSITDLDIWVMNNRNNTQYY